ncbi:hypothetical protein EV697_102221 [Bisgaardia hudsonensis]|uniref:Uncharacterized protein n=1 Tax=Bisgaardia hudsonensis TaxID=109472 RepID=A0A4R2N1C9_9PAST|nr:zf-HC2 domain-containing protein [Bisgaardia hudsonensis]TCP13340.1 hypothetical protein EV697_102221 [Bisgaardia hudsonensis]
MLKCKQVAQLVSLEKEKPLVLSQKLQIKLHLMMCSRCRAFNKNNQQLDNILNAFCNKD